ncbi:hypothetical protein QFZ28_001259 [Neobacillus niacini]|jgi:hypothetical protein|nr:hypothetical protein [Neobacillus niacini]
MKREAGFLNLAFFYIMMDSAGIRGLNPKIAGLCPILAGISFMKLRE